MNDLYKYSIIQKYEMLSLLEYNYKFLLVVPKHEQLILSGRWVCFFKIKRDVMN